jgi:hypothetical protein
VYSQALYNNFTVVTSNSMVGDLFIGLIEGALE